MECRTLSDSFSAFLDGELEVSERRQVEEHVGGCPDCREELDSLAVSYRILDETVDPLPLKAESALWQVVEAEVAPRRSPRREMRSSRPWWQRLMWLPVSAVAVLVALVILVPSQVDPQPGPEIRLQFEKFVQDRLSAEQLSAPALRTGGLDWDRSDNPFSESEVDNRGENPFSSE